jgi:hypothetical protein
MPMRLRYKFVKVLKLDLTVKKDVQAFIVKKLLIPKIFNCLPIFIIMDKQCSICGLVKNKDSFYESQRGSKCKDCVLKITREYKRKKRKDSEFKKIESQKQKERKVRLWQNDLIHKTKRNGVEHNLTIEFINELYEKQNGLCYWFKIPLIPSYHKKFPQQPSLDRLDTTKGYTKDNVVLTCYSANIGRNENSVESWENFLKILFNN